MLVTKAIPGFYNGVNQQPPAIRLDTQLEEQENGYSSLVDGLIKRPNTEHIALLSSSPSSSPNDYHVHVVNRDSSEQYIFLFTKDATAPLKVFTLDGQACLIRYGHLDEDLVFTEDLDVKNYLSSSAPRVGIRCITIADYTLFTNREVSPAMGDEVSPGTLSGKVQTFSKLTNLIPTKNVEISTGDGDTKDFEAPGYLTQDTIEVYVNDVLTTHTWKNGTYIRLATAPASGATVKVIRKAEPDVVEVAGDDSNNFDSYYVKYESEVWKEVAKPGIKVGFDPSTMPHSIVRTAEKEFTVSPIIWGKRDSGDDVSSPIPSFVGYVIKNILFFKGRLGFLSQERVILSRTNDYFNFWSGTAVDVLDDDPIDIDSSSTLPNSVVDLVEYAPFDSNLILMSANQQFSLQAANASLTPTTVAITPITGFELNPESTVGVAGTNVVFTGRRGDHLTVREYFVQPESLMNDAADVTAHIPNYIPNGSANVVVCNALDTAFILSSGDFSTLYVYKYFWSGDDKPQNCWSKWTFNGGRIYGIGLIETVLFMLIERDGSLFLEKIQLKSMEIEELGFRVHLDRFTVLAPNGVAVIGDPLRYFTIPYPVSESDFSSGRYGAINLGTGLPLTISSHELNGEGKMVIGIKNQSSNIFFGQNYNLLIRLSEQYIKDSDKAPVIDGKWLIRTFTVSFNKTGYFEVIVTPEAREPITHVYTGVVLGASLIGKPHLSTAQERFLILSKNRGTIIDITNNTYLPCSFQTGTIEGEYVTRSKRRV